MAVGYLELFGDPGMVSTPDETGLDHTGDFEMIACVAPDNWGNNAYILRKYQAYRFEILTIGGPAEALRADAWESGVDNFDNDALVSEVNGQHLWVRALVDLNGTWAFYESTDAIGTAVGSVSWSLLGTPGTKSVTAIDTNANALTVGGPFAFLVGNLHYVEMRDDATGSGATLFKLDFRDTVQADWSNLGSGVTVDSRVWTATGVKGTDWDYTPDPAGASLAAGWGIPAS